MTETAYDYPAVSGTRRILGGINNPCPNWSGRQMKKAVWSAIAVAAFIGIASPASAQSATANINATVNVSNRATLTISGDVVFADADPDTVPTMTAPSITVNARARVAPTQALEVTVQAADAFFDPGTDTIAVADLDWTATGSAFVGGTMSSVSAVQVAAWTGPANQTGTQTYTLPNLWTYVPGTHTVVLTYTLATP
jgi:hypothetical protein